MKHLGVLKNLKRVCAFQIELEFGSVVFFKGKGTTGVPGGNLSEQGRGPATNLTHI